MAAAMAHTWIDAARLVPLSDAAALVGVVIRGRMAGPCPACGRETRGSADPRGPLNVKGSSWRCQRCEEGGGPVELVAWALLGHAPARGDRDGWARLRDAFAGLVGEVPSVAPVRPPAAPAPAAPVYPPADEVAALWAECGPVDACVDSWSWLTERRRLGTAAGEYIIDHDLARTLPPAGPLPAWAARAGRSWRDSGHRLIVPLYDSAGELRSVVARFVGEGPTEVKSLAPRGCERAGLVMADPLARALLRRGAWADDWPGPRRLVLAEGEADYLTLATCFGSDTAGLDWPAIAGLVQGSWTAELARRVPAGSELILCLDVGPDGQPDEGARRLLARARETVPAGVALKVWRPPTGGGGH